jgi:LacI family transcriptional regulator
MADINYGVAKVAEDTKYEIVLLANTKAGIQRIFERILSSGLRARPLAIQHDSRSLVDLLRSGLATVLVDTSACAASCPPSPPATARAAPPPAATRPVSGTAGRGPSWARPN